MDKLFWLLVVELVLEELVSSDSNSIEDQKTNSVFSDCMMYAKLGANVVVNDMSKENAESVVADIKAGE